MFKALEIAHKILGDPDGSMEEEITQLIEGDTKKVEELMVEPIRLGTKDKNMFISMEGGAGKDTYEEFKEFLHRQS